MRSGYGRGWQEPKASGRIARVAQWLREPQTKTDIVLAALVLFAGVIWVVVMA